MKNFGEIRYRPFPKTLPRRLTRSDIGSSYRNVETLAYDALYIAGCSRSFPSFPSPSGVPQGSNLGPILFILFANDLSHQIQDSKILLYADDVKLYSIIFSPLDAISLQKDLDRLHAWALRNGLQVNLSKSNIISFSRNLLDPRYEYSIDSSPLVRADSVRDLGVTYGSTLSFDTQITQYVKKCTRLLGFIRNVTFDFRNASTLVYLYKTLILPSLTCCASIWEPHTQNNLSLLKAVEHKFLRFASRKTAAPMHYFYHGFTNIRQILRLPKLETLLARQNCIVSFKIVNKLFSSPKFNELFKNCEISYSSRDPPSSLGSFGTKISTRA